MIKVAILFGGPSSEHEVSVASAKNVLEHIDRNLFEVVEVYISKECSYTIGGDIFSEQNGLQELKNMNVDVVLPILHGAYGEDGKLQKKLEEIGIPFAFSSSQSSSLAINKNKTNEVLSKHGILIPNSAIVSIKSPSHTLTYPIVIKPVYEGSSVGLFKLLNENQYTASLDIIFKNYNEILAQECIQGREFTCGVIEKGGEAFPLVATEIILTKGEMFDYEAKYTPKGCDEITPANVDGEIMSRIQELAISCHKIIGCKTLSRTDMILKDNDLYVLEINTIPGMTKTSFIPAEAKACGYDMKELITIIINSIKR